MTGIHPIQGFNNLSKPQKAAVVAGTAAGVAAVATTAVAFAKGKQPDVKGLNAIKAGYGILFNAAKARAGQIKKAIVAHLPKKEVIKEAAEQATEVATEAAEAVQG